MAQFTRTPLNKEVVCIRKTDEWIIGPGPKFNDVCKVTALLRWFGPSIFGNLLLDGEQFFYELEGYEGFNTKTFSKTNVYNTVFFADIVSDRKLEEELASIDNPIREFLPENDRKFIEPQPC